MSEFEFARVIGGAGIGAILGTWVYLHARERDQDTLGRAGALACVAVGIGGGLALALPIAVVLVVVARQRATRAAAVRIAHLTSGSAAVSVAGRTGAHLAAPGGPTGAHLAVGRPGTGAHAAARPYATGANPAVNPFAPAPARSSDPYAASPFSTAGSHEAGATADPFGPSPQQPAPEPTAHAGTPRSAYSGDNVNGYDDEPLELDTDVPMPSRTGSRSGFVTASGSHITAQGRRTRSTPAVAQPAPAPIELDTESWGDDPTSPGPHSGNALLNLNDDPFFEANAPPEPPEADVPPADARSAAPAQAVDEFAAFWGRPPGE